MGIGAPATTSRPCLGMLHVHHSPPVGEKNLGEPSSAVGLSPNDTVNKEGGEGVLAPLAAAGEPMALMRGWVKEPWKAGDDASRKRAGARGWQATMGRRDRRWPSTLWELFVVCVMS
jgi:hypothetical protein